MPLKISELAAGAPTLSVVSERYAAAISLRGRHLKASMELSRHLSHHRC